MKRCVQCHEEWRHTNGGTTSDGVWPTGCIPPKYEPPTTYNSLRIMKCVQCHNELVPWNLSEKLVISKMVIDLPTIALGFYCTDPACPNYKILQIGE